MTKSRKKCKSNLFSLRELFIKNKDDLVVNGKIVTERNPVWQQISVGTGLLPTTLHKYAYSKKYEFREILLGEKTNIVKNCFRNPSVKLRRQLDCKVKIVKLNIVEEIERNVWNNLDLKNPFVFDNSQQAARTRCNLQLVNGKTSTKAPHEANCSSTESRSSFTPSPTRKQSSSTDTNCEDVQSQLQSLKTEVPDGETSEKSNPEAARNIASIFIAHEKLKRFLGTLVQFATGLGSETGETVRTLVLELLSESMSTEEFHSALQEATNFPLRSFVLPYLKQTLPSLQRDLNAAARAENQTCSQYLRSNESAVLEAVGLAAPTGPETVEPFVEPSAVAPATTTHHYPSTRSSTQPHLAYPGHAVKRRSSDILYYENGTAAFDDGPPYAKRWSHHHNQTGSGSHHPLHHQSHLMHPIQHQASDLAYCWYTHPLGQGPGVPSLVQIAGGVQQSGLGGYAPAPPPVSHQPHQHANISQSGSGASGNVPTQNGSSSLEDEWKNIYVMLNCILGMVDKTKRALAILQKRGSTSPGTAACGASTTGAAATPGLSLQANGGQSQPSGNGIVEVNGDRDGTFKRLSAEIMRANEDRIAEVKRRAEEAVQEVKRAALAEVQRAVAVAMAESRAGERERLRNHRYLDNLPVNQSPQRNHHPHGRPSPFLRVTEPRTIATTTTTSVVGSSTSSTVNNPDEHDKDAHLTTGCWNCGRPALETCGGCGVARYCGSFCQHRDWEAGGHHATCSNSQEVQARSPSTPSPPMRNTGAVESKNSSISLSASIARTVK